jgi:bifunctional ADP-heptose synthase (sugar kinase/adenylyltransferase)
VTIEAEAREVFDVTGAGDTVIAALAVMLATGAGLESAVRLANRAAGIVVGKLGTATATREELFGKEG